MASLGYFPVGMRVTSGLVWGKSKERRRKIWTVIPLFLKWIIERERKMKHFDVTESSMYRLKRLFGSSSYSWSRGRVTPLVANFMI